MIQVPSIALTKEEKEIVRKAKGTQNFRRGSRHAARLIEGDQSNTIQLVSGQVKFDGREVAHVWAELNGKVVDFSMKYGREEVLAIGIIPDGVEYWRD